MSSQVGRGFVPTGMPRKAALVAVVSVLVSSQAAGIDLNSSTSLRYFPDSTGFEFKVDTDGTIDTRGDIQMNGNTLDTSGSPVTLRDSTNTQDILTAREGGDVDIPSGSLDLSGTSEQGQNLLELTTSDQQTYSFQEIAGSSNDLAVKGPGGNEFIRFRDSQSGTPRFNNGLESRDRIDTRGNALVDLTGSDNVKIGDGSNDRVVLDTGGSQVDIPNGNLDLNTNNITSIDTLKFVEGTSIDGDLTINGSADIAKQLNLSSNLDAKDNNLLDANKVEANRIIDPEDGQINIDDNINLQNNQNIRSSGTNAITLDGNQNIGIPNGNLQMTGGGIIDNSGAGSPFIVQDGGSDIFRLNYDYGGNEMNIETVDNNNNQVTSILLPSEIDNAGNVEIPNGNLSITGNAPNSNLNLGGDIDTEVARIDTEGDNYLISLKSGKGFEVADPSGNTQFATGDDTTEIGSTYTFDITNNEFTLEQDDTDILTANTGSATHAIRDTANSADLVTLQEGGPVDLRNSINDEDVLRANPSGSSNVEIPNGNLDIGQPTNTGKRLDVSGGANLNGDIDLDNGGGVRNVETITGPSSSDGDLDIRTQGSGSDEVSIEDGSDSDSDIAVFSEGNQNLEVPNGALLVTDDSTISQFGSTTNSQNVPLEVASGGGTSGLRFVTSDEGSATLSYAKAGKFRLNDGLGVEGDLDLRGSRVIDATNTDEVKIGDGDSNTVRVEAGGTGEAVIETGDASGGSTERIRVRDSAGKADIEVSNADIDMKGNSVGSSSGEICIGDQCA